MAHLAVDAKENETIFQYYPKRGISGCVEALGIWQVGKSFTDFVSLPKGSIEKLIGRKLTWEDEPVELKEGE